MFRRERKQGMSRKEIFKKWTCWTLILCLFATQTASGVSFSSEPSASGTGKEQTVKNGLKRQENQNLLGAGNQKRFFLSNNAPTRSLDNFGASFQSKPNSKIFPNSSKKELPLTKEAKYLPYLELGGMKHFNQYQKGAGVYDLFIPLWQTSKRLFFTDLRIFDRAGKSFEGNVHVGYRQLNLDNQEIFGIYSAFDRRRTEKGNYFNQLTLGGEYWSHNWFIGGNFYHPIGKKKRYIGGRVETKQFGKQIHITEEKKHEQALLGIDGELGYSFMENLTGYIGGYYFSSSETKTILGPKIRLTYDCIPRQGKRFLGIFDGLSFEAGAQRDKPRGMNGYVGVRLKVGLTSEEKNSNLSKTERHMIELVRRDPDIVIGDIKRSEHRTEEGFYQEGEYGFRFGEDLSKEKSYLHWETEDLLAELDLEGDVTWQEIKKRRRELLFQHHPDKGGKSEEFIRINAICDVLDSRFNPKIETERPSKEPKSSFSPLRILALSSGQDAQINYQKDEKIEGSAIRSFALQNNRRVKQETGIERETSFSPFSSFSSPTGLVANTRKKGEKKPISFVNAGVVLYPYQEKRKEYPVFYQEEMKERSKEVYNRDNFSRKQDWKETGIQLRKDKAGESVLIKDDSQMWRSNITSLTERKLRSDSPRVRGLEGNEGRLDVYNSGICLAEKDSNNSSTFWSGISWLGEKVWYGAKWIYERPRILIGGAITVVTGGVTRYLLNRGQGGAREPRGEDEDFFFDGWGGGFPPGDDDFPFGRKRSRRETNWREILSKVPLFFTVSSGGMTFPVLLPRSDPNEELRRLALGSVKRTPSMRFNPSIRPLVSDLSLNEVPAERIGKEETHDGKGLIESTLGSSSSSDLTHQVEAVTRLLQQILRSDRRDYFGGTTGLVPLVGLSDWNYRRGSSILSTSRARSDVERREEGVNLAYEYEDQDMNALLQLRAQEAGLNLRRTVIIAPLNNARTQLQQHLVEERERYRREVLGGRSPFARTVLIPLNLYNLHWVGLIIRFNAVGQVERIQYVDPLGYGMPRGVEATLRELYGRGIVIQNLQGLRQTDGMACGPLTIENLIRVAQNRLENHDIEEREIREIRRHHINLLERFEPTLQFYFRQRRGVRSFEYRTTTGMKLLGGIFAGLEFPRGSFGKIESLLNHFFPGIKIAIHGGMEEVMQVDDAVPLLHPQVISLRETLKQLLMKFGSPNLLSILIAVIGDSIGAVMISKISTEALAANGLIATGTAFLNAPIACTYIAQNFIAETIGDEDAANLDVGLTFQQSWIMDGILTLPAIMLSIFSAPIFEGMGQSIEVSSIAQDYFRGYVWGIPATYLLNTNVQNAIGLKKPIFMLPTIFTQRALMLGIAYPLMFGKLGLPVLGTAGLGYAYSISSWLTLIGSTFYFTKNEFRDYGIFRFRGREGRLERLGRLFILGLPVGLFVMNEFLAAQLSMMMMGWIDDEALAGAAIATQYVAMFLMPSMALAESTSALISNTAGERNYRNSARIGNIGTIASSIVPITGLIVFSIFSSQLISLFLDVNDPANAAIVSNVRTIFLISGAGILYSLRNVAGAALRGFKDTSFAMWMSIIGTSIIGFPLAYLLGFPCDLGVVGVVVGGSLGVLFSSTSILTWWIRGSRRAIQTGVFEPWSFRNWASRTWNTCCSFLRSVFCFCCRRR